MELFAQEQYALFNQARKAAKLAADEAEDLRELERWQAAFGETVNSGLQRQASRDWLVPPFRLPLP